MKKHLSIALVAGFLAFCFGAADLNAQTSQTIDITVNLLEWYDLDLNHTTLTFNDLAPTPGPTPPSAALPAQEGPVTVTAFALLLPGSGLQLTATAGGDLLDSSTGSTIGVGALTWTASGPGFQDGTLATSAQTVGTWAGLVGGFLHYHVGNLSFSFNRDYANQAPGTYTATVTYTLSSI